MKNTAPIKFFAGRNSKPLAEKIARSFGVELGETTVLEFSDGEIQPYYNESVRGCTVFLVQSTPPPAENILEKPKAGGANRSNLLRYGISTWRAPELCGIFWA